MYEKLISRPLSRRMFIRRMLYHLGLMAAVVVLSLAIGVGGLICFENLSLHNALLQAAMLLSGVGVIEKPVSEAGHWFVAIYSLYSGLVFIIAFGVVLAPVIHRLLHKFHWSGTDDE